MKCTVAVLFALAVAGSVSGQTTCDQCPNYPTALSSLRIGDLIQGLIYRVVQFIVQSAFNIFQAYIPENTVVPVQPILTEFAASPCPTLRTWVEVSVCLLGLGEICPLLNSVPYQLQNIQLNAAAVAQYITSRLQNCPTVYFPEWGQAFCDFLTQSVTNDLVNLFNTVPAL